MAVIEYSYKENEKDKERYVGCVLDTWERNGSWDSDFYAVCWDEEKQKVVDVMYDTTSCGSLGTAKIDATPDVLRKAYRYYYNTGRRYFDEIAKIAEAKKVRKDDTVVVTRGRKTPKGTVGKVFWVGTRFNFYTHLNEERVGIEVGGDKVFLPLDYVEVVGWEKRVVSGAERKRWLRHNAIAKMPYQYRRVMLDGSVFRKEVVYV